MPTLPDFLRDTSQTPTCPVAPPPIERQWEVLTPMFLAGAGGGDQVDITREGLRGASVKALLRWWWRATVSGISTVAELHEAEGRLFGDTEHGQGIRVVTGTTTKWSMLSTSDRHHSQGLAYLLGQGLYRDGLKRPAIAPGSTVHLRIDVKEPAVATALQAFELCGGLGSRARRGWGSIAPALADDRPTDPNDYARRIGALLAGMPKQPRAWSCLTSSTRYVVLQDAHAQWKDALEDVGRRLQTFRAGFGGKGPKFGKDYGPDHELVVEGLRTGILKTAPKRAAFGIPHNYFFSSSKQQVAFHGSETDRRASPLILHITRYRDNRYGACALLLDGVFLPHGVTLQAISRNIARGDRLPQPSLQIIHDFLDRLPAAKA